MNATIKASSLKTRAPQSAHDYRVTCSPGWAASAAPPSPAITKPFVLRFVPGDGIRLRLAVQADLNGSEPINRDHDQPYYQANGLKLADQRQMRQGLIRTVAEHLQDLQTRYPTEQILGFTGNGNLLANYRFVAWAGEGLFHLSHEPVFTEPYTGLVSWKTGGVTLEDVWFARENGGAIVLRASSQHASPGANHGTLQDITAQVDFVTTGQPLIRQGRPVPLEQVAQLYYDTRHLVQPLALRLPKTMLFVPNAQFQRGLQRKALTEAVQIKLMAELDDATVLPLLVPGLLRLAQEQPETLARAQSFLLEQGLLAEGENLQDTGILTRVAGHMEGLLDRALDADHYRMVPHSRPLQEGEARFVNGHLEIFFRKGINPHNIFVRWRDGHCGFVVFPGKSGRAGVTLPDAQEFLNRTLAVQEAVLLDNGGDVRLWYRGQYVAPSSEGREELRSLLAVTAPAGAWVGDRIQVS